MNQISLFQFLVSLEKRKNLPAVVSFCAKVYPILFFRNLLFFLKNNKFSIQNVNGIFDEHGLHVLSTTLFLGQKKLYWLGNIDVLDVQNKKKIISFLSAYTGPHQLWFFSEKKLILNSCNIVLPSSVYALEYNKLFHFFFKKKMSDKEGFPYILKEQAFTLDTACLLMSYQQVIGRNIHIFCSTWLDRLVIPEKSLFALSEAFFAQKRDTFFQVWDYIGDTYPHPFWIAYWSEQFFRAYSYIYYMKNNEQASAKKSGFRLPFSFVNRDWRRITMRDIWQLHQLLYQIEYHFKNGNQKVSFEVLYFSFLSR